MGEQECRIKETAAEQVLQAVKEEGSLKATHIFGLGEAGPRKGWDGFCKAGGSQESDRLECEVRGLPLKSSPGRCRWGPGRHMRVWDSFLGTCMAPSVITWGSSGILVLPFPTLPSEGVRMGQTPIFQQAPCLPPWPA